MSHHHHTPEERLLEDALALGCSWEGERPGGIALEELKAGTARGLEQIAARLAEDGILYGHVKALLSWEDGTGRKGRAAFSVTRLGETDQTMPDLSPVPDRAERWKLTVNAVSFLNTGALEEGELRGFFPA